MAGRSDPENLDDSERGWLLPEGCSNLTDAPEFQKQFSHDKSAPGHAMSPLGLNKEWMKLKRDGVDDVFAKRFSKLIGSMTGVLEPDLLTLLRWRNEVFPQANWSDSGVVEAVVQRAVPRWFLPHNESAEDFAALREGVLQAWMRWRTAVRERGPLPELEEAGFWRQMFLALVARSPVLREVFRTSQERVTDMLGVPPEPHDLNRLDAWTRFFMDWAPELRPDDAAFPARLRQRLWDKLGALPLEVAAAEKNIAVVCDILRSMEPPERREEQVEPYVIEMPDNVSIQGLAFLTGLRLSEVVADLLRLNGYRARLGFDVACAVARGRGFRVTRK